MVQRCVLCRKMWHGKRRAYGQSVTVPNHIQYHYHYAPKHNREKHLHSLAITSHGQMGRFRRPYACCNYWLSLKSSRHTPSNLFDPWPQVHSRITHRKPLKLLGLNSQLCAFLMPSLFLGHHFTHLLPLSFPNMIFRRLGKHLNPLIHQKHIHLIQIQIVKTSIHGSLMSIH